MNMDRARPGEGIRGLIGTVLCVAGLGCWVLVLISLVFAAQVFSRQNADFSTLPLIAATLGGIGTLAWAAGWRVMNGLPLHVPFTRRVLGVVLLLIAAIFVIASREDSRMPWWIAAVLGVGGLLSLLTWKKGVAESPPVR